MAGTGAGIRAFELLVRTLARNFMEFKYPNARTGTGAGRIAVPFFPDELP